MKNRYKKFVFENEKGITFNAIAEEGKAFEVSEGTNGELIIRALKENLSFISEFPVVSAGECAEELSVYIDKDGNKAVIPPGWAVSGLNKENTIFGEDIGLVIYQIPWVRKVNWENPEEVEEVKKTYSQFVWCPVAMLDSDGTLDGQNFNEKFGRRNYRNNEFSDGKYHEDLSPELLRQIESVKKYGGFYISRYNISKGSEGKPQSVKGVMPWVNIDFEDAKKMAATFDSKGDVTSHLTYGAEYDSVLAWFIKSKARTFEEIAEDSTNWGNHWNTNNSPRKVVKTGSREEWCTNGIYDFAGNVDEWTQEQNDSSFRVIRGGYYDFFGDCYPVSYRDDGNPCDRYDDSGFRTTLCIR